MKKISTKERKYCKNQNIKQKYFNTNTKIYNNTLHKIFQCIISPLQVIRKLDFYNPPSDAATNGQNLNYHTHISHNTSLLVRVISFLEFSLSSFVPRIRRETTERPSFKNNKNSVFKKKKQNT